MYSFIKNTVMVVLEIFGVGKAEIWATRITLILIVLTLIAVLCVIGWVTGNISSCNSANRQKKIDAAANSEAEGKGVVKEIKEHAEDIKIHSNQASANSAAANSVFDDALKRDSKHYSANWGEAKRNACRQFPDDDLCKH